MYKMSIVQPFRSICKSNNNTTGYSNKHSTNAVIISAVLLSSVNKRTSTTPKLPTIEISASLQMSGNYIKLTCVPDTGTQLSVAGPSLLTTLNIPSYIVNYTSQKINHVGGEKMDVLGKITIFLHHNDVETPEEIHIVNGINKLFLSLNTCKSLKLIHKDFSMVHLDESSEKTSVVNSNETIDAENNPGQVLQSVKRDAQLPSRPANIPFRATEENIPKLKLWLPDAFRHTTFKTTSQPLPTMNCRPYEITLIEPDEPYHANIPIPVPHYWRDEVKKQLDEDEALGIIRKVSQGETTDWCMRMVVVSKRDGKPRRTMDFQPLNKYSKREVHYTEPPFSAVSSISLKMYKSSCDAFNGYHQVPLAESSIALTTFVAPWGRYQYLRAPQGHVSSGDGYTRRYDDITTDVPRKRKIVDDVLLFDNTIESSFYHVFDYLYLSGRNGITQNPIKFRFCQKEIEFAGFLLGWDSFRPSNGKLSAIKNYTMPDLPSITDIRSWFGLVNQLSPFVANGALP